jgi:hypothetical protein
MVIQLLSNHTTYRFFLTPGDPNANVYTSQSSSVMLSYKTCSSTSGTIHGITRLCGSSWGSSDGVDVRAEQGLSENGENAALGLLSLSGADVDEVVDAGRGGGG